LAFRAHAALPDEIQVYTDDLEKRGEWGVELHVNTTPSGRSTSDYPGEITPRHGLRVTPEISTGLTPDWDAGLYLPFTRSSEGDYYFAGPKFRLKWLPKRPPEGGTGGFAGLNFELAFVERRFVEARRTLELRPIVGMRGSEWLFAFNPTVGTDLAGAERNELMFHPSAKLAHDIGQKRALGVEYYADVGKLGNPLPRREQTHTLFLVLDSEGSTGFNLGIGRGLTGVSDRWTIKAIISF